MSSAVAQYKRSDADGADLDLPIATVSQEARTWLVTLLVITATALGLAVRLFRLDHPALWLDEFSTYVYTLQPWDALFGALRSIDVHPPYYYALQKLWSVFGDSRTAMRTLPVLFGTACIPLLFVLGRRLLSTRAGVIAAFLLTTAPMHVYYSRELRMYALLNLSALVAFIGLAYAIPIRNHARSLLGWSCYVAGAVSAFYAQTSAALLPVLGFGLVATLVLVGHAPRRVLYECLAAHVVILLAAAPWLLDLAHHVSGTLADFWIPEPSVGWVISQVLGAYPYPLWLKPLVYATFLVGLWMLRKHVLQSGMILTFVAGQPALLWALSYVRPIMIVRAMIWPTSLTLLLPAALFARWKRGMMVFATGAFVVLQMFALPEYFPAERERSDAEGIRAALRGFDSERDVIVLEQQTMEFEFRYEAPEALPRGHVIGLTNGDSRQFLEPLLTSRHVRRNELDEATRGKRVWLVSEIQPRFAADVKQATERLVSQRRELGKWTSGNLALMLLET